VDKSDLKNDDQVIPLFSEVFRPLLKFTGLLSVAFEGLGNYHLDNWFINDIPDAWPSIQVLRFASYRPSSWGVTFTVMVSFASRCKSLRSLHLTCVASQPTIIPQAEDGTEGLWPAQTALRKLHLEHSFVPDSEVARMPYILANVFPALSSVDCYWYVGSANFDHRNDLLLPLQEVCEQLKVLRQLAGQDDHHDTFWDNSDMEWDSDDSEEGDSMGGV
jgi:hypothetical protein